MVNKNAPLEMCFAVFHPRPSTKVQVPTVQLKNTALGFCSMVFVGGQLSRNQASTFVSDSVGKMTA